MPRFVRQLSIALLAAGLCLTGQSGQAADPAAPARDNIPRIWRALSGDRVELDGQNYALRGVSCPTPESDAGRQAKALLNTFLLGSKHSRGISCKLFGAGAAASVDCTRNGRTAAALMIDSGLCHAQDGPADLAEAGKTFALTRHQSGYDQISYWRLRSCIGVHPDRAPRQCRHASRTWPLRYVEAVLWRERQKLSGCPTAFPPATSAVAPKAAHGPPSRYSLRPLVHIRCRNGSGGH